MINLISDDMTPTYDDWVGALDLATMWDFAKVSSFFNTYRLALSLNCTIAQLDSKTIYRSTIKPLERQTHN